VNRKSHSVLYPDREPTQPEGGIKEREALSKKQDAHSDLVQRTRRCVCPWGKREFGATAGKILPKKEEERKISKEETCKKKSIQQEKKQSPELTGDEGTEAKEGTRAA